MPRTDKEKKEQNRFFFWYKKENKDWIKDSLTKVKRFDLLKRLIDNDDSTIKSDKSRSFKKGRQKPVKKGKRKGRTRK